ncbi:MAG: hypothetical protein MUO76_00185, partial [Anaerolineaceae bacterium]|nr:hypothetical protein [Anaerolineaceae bacterium]
PGTPSAGSTAPLWSALLSLGHLIEGFAFFWTILLGGCCLWLLSLLGEYIVHRQAPERRKGLPLMALFLAGEWHLLWAAASGMETIIFALTIVIFFAYLYKKDKEWWVMGGVVGLSVWLRPDGITLLGPALFVITFESEDWKNRLTKSFKLFLGFGIIFLLYLIFNNYLSGSIWPNTFYAKQREYAILLESPFLSRFFSLLVQPLIGAGVLLLPGFLFSVFNQNKLHSSIVLSAYLWFLGYIFIYSLRLPVTYQHARYLIPAMPVYFIYAYNGFIELVKKINSKFQNRLITKAWYISILVVWFLFLIIGGNAYAHDVALIESEMVVVGKWIANNTEADDLIAAHDIGAIGFFAKRNLVDLAGLVSPEVIKFFRNEDKISEYLFELDVDYLITFPGWYPNLVKQGEVIFITKGIFSPTEGGENMHVYKWPDSNKTP